MPVLSHRLVARTFGCPACLLATAAAAAVAAKSKLKLGPSWVLVLRNALEIIVEERPLAFEMCLHAKDECPETWLKKGSFSPQNGPPCGTTAWYTPY